MSNVKTVVLKLTAAVVIDGQILRAGTKVEMIESEARQLLSLGKATIDSVPNDTPNKVDAAAQAAAAQAAADAVKAAPATPEPAPVAAKA